MSTPQMLQAIVPLPIPRTSEAPMFDGKRLMEFMSILRQHGLRAGISRDDLVPYILQYCTEDVKNVLRHSPELKPGAHDWAAAEEEMRSFYGSEDQPTLYSVEDLRQFCNETSAKPPFETRSDIEAYMRRFREIAGTLLDENLLTQKEIDIHFVTGLPKKTFKQVDNKLPAANRVITNPPSIKEVRKLLDGLFVPNSLQTFTRNNFSVETEAQLAQPVAKPVQKAVRFEQPQAIVPAVSTLCDSLSMDDIVTRLDQLTISNAELKSLIESTARTAAAPGGGRLLAADGSEIPSAIREPRGIAQLLRSHRDTAAGNNTTAVMAQYDGHSALGSSVLAVSADDENTHYTDPALRSGHDTGARHDPYAKPKQAKGKETASKPPTQNQNPPQPPVAGPSTEQCRDPPPHLKPPPSIPVPPMHPLNTEEGWRQRERQQKSGERPKNKEDVEMTDPAKKQWRFTSDIQESVSVNTVYDKTMDATVTLPVCEIFAISPPLQKKLQEATHRRCEYVTSNGEYEIFSLEVAKAAAAGTIATGATQPGLVLHLGDTDNDDELRDHFTSLHAVSSMTSCYLAFATGMVTVKIKGYDVRCLVDTGSELNLISHTLVNTLGLPIDVDGNRWSLLGVHGGSDRLVGLCRNVSMDVGGHDFAHHLFISRNSPGRIDFTRAGTMDLLLWKEGDRSHPPNITVRLLRPGNERNQTDFEPSPQSSAVEYDYGDDDDEDFR
ncbi:hypothetical protein DFH08DRAFT_953090 [Mycena albidolilacea]|uniref:DUF4100 domain-containing protein n=1 Tax=Mycena albidolilacea TaxID=1033008 RepID=A0AAD7AG02_9AGAR|nr:hypothetical protein DFH08DRAFT_953090 [Mycena albidolilacea]